MSPAFRIFLLILCGFGAIWIHRFRQTEIRAWLRPPRPPRQLVADRALISPVDRVLDADGTLRLWILGKEPERRAGGEAAALTEEEQCVAADLALVEEMEEAEDVDLAAETPAPSPQPPAGPGGEPGNEEIPQPPDNGAAAEPAEPAPAGPAPDPAAIVAFREIAYKVEEGDNLWKIAERFLGSGKRFREIRDWNRELFARGDMDAVPTGAVLKVRVPAASPELKPGPLAVDKPVERDSPPRKPKLKPKKPPR